MQHQRFLARYSGQVCQRQSLRRNHRLTANGFGVLLVMLLLLGSLAGDAQAQSPYDFTIGIMGGIGGATDSEPDSGLTNLGLQVLFAVDKDNHTRFSTRLGSIDLDTEEFGDIFQVNSFDATLTYLTLSGEYMFDEPNYESGVFIGLGLYEVTDSPVFENGAFRTADESTIGLTLGASGDFQVGDHWSVLGEISGHYADLDYGRFFVMAHVGIGFHF